MTMAAAIAGMLGNLAGKRVSSKVAEGAIGFGAAVMRGADKERGVLVATTGAAAIGFALHTHGVEQNAAGVAQYAAKGSVNVLEEGEIWVNTNDAVVAGAVANLHVASGKLTDAAVAAGIEAFEQISVRFQTSTAAAGLALVSVVRK